jgi:RNA polymerase sigma-B factor
VKSGESGAAVQSTAIAVADSAELFARWHRAGDREAREELVKRYLPLARKLAHRYSSSREPLDDLLQVASLGLLKAVDRFDAARGNTFSSFAVPTIVGELKRYFRDVGWSVHVPRGAQELALRVQGAEERLTTKTGRPPAVNELAEYLEMSIEEVVEALEAQAAQHATSLQLPIDDGAGGSGTLADTVGEADGGFDRVDSTTMIGAAARQLTERERQVLLLRFFEDRTQTQIAQMIGASQMQVSRILRQALDRLSQLTNEI